MQKCFIHINYSECIDSEGVRNFSVTFTVFIGPAKAVGERDTCSRDLGRMKDTSAYLLQVLPALVPRGSPLWKLEQSTVYDLFNRGIDLGFRLVVNT